MKLPPFLRRFTSIQTQLILGFGLILTLALVIAIIGYFSLQNLQQGTEETLNEASRIRELSLSMENNFLLARQSESNFLNNWRIIGFDEASTLYVEDNQMHLNDAKTTLAELRDVTARTDKEALSETLPQIDQLEPLLDEYETAFLQTVTQINERSNADGVEQTLQNQWDELEAITANLPNEAFYRLVLQMRVAEQAYFNSNRQQYVDTIRLLTNQFTTLAESTDEDLLVSDGEPISSEELSQKALAYRTTFNQLVTLDQDIRVNTVIFRDVTSDINEITQSLGDAGKTTLERARTEQQTISDQSRVALIATTLIALGLGILTALILARRIIRPLNQLTQAAQAIGEGNLEQTVDVSGHDEFSTLGTIFNQMTVQLRELVNHLEERVSTRTRDLALAANVSKEITTVLDVDDLLQEVVRLTVISFNFYSAFVFLFDEESNSLLYNAGADSEGKLLEVQGLDSLPLNARPSIVAQTARTQEATLVNDVLKAENYLRNPVLPDTRSELAIPMILGENLLGVFDLQSASVDRFTDDDVRVLTSLAEQITVAVNNAQLFSEVKEAQAAAEQANRVKSQFLASMSHELRTPLNAILNFTQFVSSGIVGPVNEEQVDLLDKSVMSGEHLLNLINDVLDISKIEAGSLELFVEEDVDLKNELAMVVTTTENILSEKSVEIRQELEDDLPKLLGDKQRIRQIMLNLVSNACKFTDAGLVTIRARREGEMLLFSVEDTGPGIAADDFERIFEVFHQTEVGLRHGGGTGLGLPISRRLAEAHGGKLWLESTLGKGTTFYVSLPIKSPLLTPTL